MNELVIWLAYFLLGLLLGWSANEIRIKNLRQELHREFLAADQLRSIISSVRVSSNLSIEDANGVGANSSVDARSLPTSPHSDENAGKSHE